MASPIDSLMGEIKLISSAITTLNDKVELVRHDLDHLIEESVETPNVWLKPAEISKLLGVSKSTITAWRNQGIFDRKISVKTIKRAKRIAHYYHRYNALKDASVVRPAHQIVSK